MQDIFWRNLKTVIGDGSSKETGPIALAVSGGGDSMALLALAYEASKAHGFDILCLTVDHGLRPESAAEAAQVAAYCRSISIAHKALRWQAPKPQSGMQAAARAARYGLLIHACYEAGASVLLTGHTAEDQAETVFNRFSRGAGAEGLAAMRGTTWVAIEAAHPIRLVRPLLSYRRADLRAYAEQKGLVISDDPSNEDPAYERIRTRRLLTQLEADNVLSVDALCRTAKRQQSVLKAQDDLMRRDWNAVRGVCTEDGAINLRTSLFRKLPEERKITLLKKCIYAISGSENLPSADAVAALISQLETQKTSCLARTMVTHRANMMCVLPELAAILGRRDGRVLEYYICIKKSIYNNWLLWNSNIVVEFNFLKKGRLEPAGKHYPELTSFAPAAATLPIWVSDDPNSTILGIPSAVKKRLNSRNIPWNIDVDTLNIKLIIEERLWQRIIRFEKPQI